MFSGGRASGGATRTRPRGDGDGIRPPNLSGLGGRIAEIGNDADYFTRVIEREKTRAVVSRR